MKTTYEIIKHELANYQSIKRIDENGIISFIPFDEANPDYQAYLRHLAGEEESGTLS